MEEYELSISCANVSVLVMFIKEKHGGFRGSSPLSSPICLGGLSHDALIFRTGVLIQRTHDMVSKYSKLVLSWYVPRHVL